ncbi:MAG: hypothetical protein QOE10_895 [Gaiellales bacterium]|nr:hypothetical protein [Gaiellales bacterium]
MDGLKPVLDVRYVERIAFPAEPEPRFWRGNLQVVAAAWGGVLAGFIPGIALDLPILAGIAIGLATGAGVLALPTGRSRRADIAIEVTGGELRLTQGSRQRRVRLADIRRVSVLAPVGADRRPVGYGLVFGNGLRFTFDVPDAALGVVRIDRGRDGLDIDVATARPDELVSALRGPADR